MARPRTFIRPSGFRVTCRHAIRAAQRTPMADALARLDDALHVHWTHSSGGFAHYIVDSLGVQWLREELAVTQERVAFAQERVAFAHEVQAAFAQPVAAYDLQAAA